MNNKRYRKDGESSFQYYVQDEREEYSSFAKSLLSFVLGMCIVLGIMLWFVQQDNLIKQIFGEDSVITTELLSIGEVVRNHGRNSLNVPFLISSSTKSLMTQAIPKSIFASSINKSMVLISRMLFILI